MGEIIFSIVLCFFTFAIFLTLWVDWKDQKLREKELEQRKSLAIQPETKAEASNAVLHTRDLFLDTLTEIGCQYQLGEDDDKRIFFTYQGEHFFADATNDIAYVQLWDTYWGHIELYDIDEMSRLRKAINTSNMKTSVTAFYTTDEMRKNFVVHSKTTIPFLSTIPELDDYLKVELNEFFRAHNVVGAEMQKLKEKEQQC